MHRRKGFTLIELLVVIAIIAVLSTVVILTLNPAELLRQSRDSTRISDLETLKNTISLYLTDVSPSDLASSTFGDSVAYFSQNDPPNISAVFDGIQSVDTASTTGSDSRNIDSTGWLPVDFTQFSSGAPISILPVDPINSTSSFASYGGSPFIYGYVATSTGSKFKVTAHMESVQYGGGQADVEGTDDGISQYTYEVGSDLTL